MMPRPALQSRLRNLKQENPMNVNHYIGFDVHKKSVSYCVKTGDGRIVEEGKLSATRQALRRWAQQRTEPWHGAMEATLFSGWIYDALKPYAAELQMGHPAMMKAIGASKKKNDRLDARKTADLVRCNLLPACYVAPVEIRELRRLLRYRNVVVAQAVRMKNKMSGLLMEVGAPYNKQRLHGKQYFSELLDQLEEVPESVKDLLRLSRTTLEAFEAMQQQLMARLRQDPLLTARVKLLTGIGGVGIVTALTWVLEVGEPRRFSSIAHAGELLRTHRGAGIFGRQTTAWADLQATQRALADDVDRGGEAGATLESAVGRGTHARTGARPSQPGHSGGGAETGGVSAGGGQIRPAIRSSRPSCPGAGKSGVNTGSELTSRIICDPTQAARRPTLGSGTVLAVKGSLRRANTGRALDRCVPFRMKGNHDGRLRQDHNQTRLRAAPQRFAANPPAVPLVNGDCTREIFLLMCHSVCFEAGRFTLIQSSRTAMGCSRKWMSGPAQAWALFVTDRLRYVALCFGPVTALRENLPPSAGRGMLSLDRPLSWMSL